VDPKSANTSFLNFPGEMARLIREKDWSQTPFGPMEGWSTALRSAVSIILGSRFPMVLYWGETRALIYNDAWAPVLGQKHPWALGMPGTEVWAEIWDIIGPMFDQVMNEGVATWSEDQLLPLNRYGYVEECYFYYSYSPVRGDDGTVEGVFTAVTETTYRVLAERRERLLREISEVTSNTRSAADACNVALERLLTLPEEAPYALAYLRNEETGLYDAVRHDPRVPVNPRIPHSVDLTDPDRGAIFAEAARTGSPTLVENIRQRLAIDLPGTPWPEPVEQCLVVPILSPRPNEPHGFLVPALSPRRRYDTEYGTLFERIAGFVTAAITNAEAYEEERRRAEKLAELDRAKTAFFSNASHEFRTPLTLMLGPVEEMLRIADGPEREELALVHRNGQRLLRLVNTLLDFSRIEAGRVRAAFEPVDLSAYTAELASSFRSAMERAGLSYAIETETLNEPVWVDREMWEKIVLNLLSNAFKYTLEGGVTVLLSAEAGRVRLAVTDTGVGIPEDELPKVFDRFHRIEGQQGRTHEGTGIGLALVKDLAQLHGGDVEVSSEVGSGTTFSVTVPLGRAHVPAESATTDTSPTSTAVRAETFVSEALRWLPDATEPPAAFEEMAPLERAQGERILLADDNADMRGYVERLLTAAGYRVDAVPDGLAAAERALVAAPDLVLSDVMMPHLDGFGLVERLRSDEATADLPIILLSARAGEEESIEGLAAGADDYLVKPFSARELIARVEGALRLARSRRETSEVLRDANEALETRVAEATRERDRSWTLSRDLIGVANFDGVWQAVNPAWERVLGWRPGKVVGRTSQWMEHPDDVEKTRAEIARLADGAVTFEFENRFRKRDGGYAILSWTAVPEEGHLYCIARDVTEERERSAELALAQEALRQSQKMEAIGKLTGGIAHDFNNMLTGVIGSLDLLQRRIETDDPRITRYVQAATTSAQRAAALTHRLLAFGRQQSLELHTVDVNRLVAGMEDLLHRTLGENVQLVTQLSADAWQGCTDTNQLENALLNLCINARDAMPEGGDLVISTANRKIDRARRRVADAPEPGDYVTLSVRDSGTGMDPETLAKVFDPFFTTKPIGKGTGLGLSTIYGFAQQMKGTVEIDSAPGKGTTVTLLIPRSRGSEVVTCAEDEVVLGGGEAVLVVEDEAEVRMLVTETLEELGYSALEATDSSSALALLRAGHRVDLMVSDVGLPGMNGRKLADEARKLRPGLRVLLITGYAADAADRIGFLGNDISMMQKPFAIEALSNTIRKLLEGQQ
jgi:PAS domain S-box-containing protein